MAIPKTDDRKAILNDIIHMETVLWKEILELYREGSPPSWERLTKRQLKSVQGSMVKLIWKIHKLKVEEHDNNDPDLR